MLFDKPGKVNTDETLNAVRCRVRGVGRSGIVAAASTGEAADKAFMLKPAGPFSLWNLHFPTIICKPLDF